MSAQKQNMPGARCATNSICRQSKLNVARAFGAVSHKSAGARRVCVFDFLIFIIERKVGLSADNLFASNLAYFGSARAAVHHNVRLAIRTREHARSAVRRRAVPQPGSCRRCALSLVARQCNATGFCAARAADRTRTRSLSLTNGNPSLLLPHVLCFGMRSLLCEPVQRTVVRGAVGTSTGNLCTKRHKFVT